MTTNNDIVTTDTNTIFAAPRIGTDVVTYDPDTDTWYVTLPTHLLLCGTEQEALALWSEWTEYLNTTKEGNKQ
jgi:hypothetical protein